VARVSGAAGKAFLSGRAAVLVVLCAVLAGWGVFAAHKAGLVWDASGHGLEDATALVAELRPDAAVTLVLPSPLERLLLPLSRRTGRLKVETVDAARLGELPVGPYRDLVAGDVQVKAGGSWLVLHAPDLPEVLTSLAALSAPDVVEGGEAPLDAAVDPASAHPEQAPAAGGRARALVWALTGLMMPTGVAVGGLWWRVRRRGR
jgi:hypothetical protein